MDALERESRKLVRTFNRLHKNVDVRLAYCEKESDGKGFVLGDALVEEINLCLKTASTLAKLKDTQIREARIHSKQLTEERAGSIIELMKRLVFQDIDFQVKPGIERELIDEITANPLKLAPGVNPVQFAKDLAVAARRPVVEHRSKMMTGFMSDALLGNARRPMIKRSIEQGDDSDA